jgi:uncharacterized protein YbjT (DUF2867 family)
MSKILLVFGATGQQGGSVVDYVMNDAELSNLYSIRAVTRDPSSLSAQNLRKKGIDVVKADVNDNESLEQIMKDVHTVFSMTLTVYDQSTKQREIKQGKAIADTAVAAGVQYLIYSSLPHTSKISSGRFQKMGHFDGKAEVEEYIRTLPIKSAFFAPGTFMQNFRATLKPFPKGDGSYVLSNFVRPETQLPLIDIAEDTGKYIGAVLAEPDKYEGKVLCAATRLYSFDEIVQVMSEATGKTVKYNRLPESTFRSFLPLPLADHLIDMFSYFEAYGYFGPKTKEQITWSAEQARGKLTTLDEYLTKSPLQLRC